MEFVPRPDLAAVPDEQVLEVAFHARRRSDHQDAVERFLTVYQRDTTNPFVLIEAAQCEASRLRYTQMQALLDLAATLVDGDALVWQMIGDAWLAHHFPEEALAAYAAGRKLDPGDMDLAARTAVALERANRVPEARALIEKLSPAQRRQPALQPVRITLARREGRFDKAIEWAIHLLREPGITPDVQSHVRLELARALDAAGRPEEAWSNLLASKAILAANPESEFERQLFPRHVDFLSGIQKKISPAHIAKWRSEAAGLEPRKLAFLIGHPRSGTTLLERILDAHTDIAAVSEYPTLEICMSEAFRSRDSIETALFDDSAPDINLATFRAHYWNKMAEILPSPIGSRLLLDKNPGLTDGVHAILRFFSEAKLLVMLRDPRDVILSCLFQDFGWTRLGVACHSLPGAIAAWEATMSHWVTLRSLIPQDQWKEIRYEDFVAGPDSCIAGITEFLECDSSTLEASEALSADRFIRTPTYSQIGKSIHSDAAGKWKRYENHFTPYRVRLTPLMEALGYEW